MQGSIVNIFWFWFWFLFFFGFRFGFGIGFGIGFGFGTGFSFSFRSDFLAITSSYILDMISIELAKFVFGNKTLDALIEFNVDASESLSKLFSKNHPGMFLLLLVLVLSLVFGFEFDFPFLFFFFRLFY
jgi:hypothetical protein